LGGDARGAIEALGLETLAAMPRFRVQAHQAIGTDMLTLMTREG
jgi:hypothetical protein